jgi:ribonuclease P protein subunit POP4
MEKRLKKDWKKWDSESNFLKGEFIGMKTKILASNDPSLIGIDGIIIDETRNTFLIDINGKEKRIAKDIVMIKIGGRIIDGKKIKYRPEDRIKRIKKA